MGPLVGQHRGDLVLLDRGHPGVGDQALQASAHVAERHPRGGEADSRVPADLDLHVPLRIEVADEVQGPAVPGLARVPDQRVGVEGHQLLVQVTARPAVRAASCLVPPSVRGTGAGEASLRSQPEPRSDDVLARAGAGARAPGQGRSPRVELDHVRPHLQAQPGRLLIDDLHPDRLEVLARPAQQAAVGQRRPRVVVVTAQLLAQRVANAHAVTLTSQAASWPGVSAAISMPQSARRWALCRS